MTPINQPQPQYVARFFLVPDGKHVVDFLLPPGEDMNTVMMKLQMDRAFWSSFNLVRWESILFATTYPVNQLPPQAKPNLGLIVPFNSPEPPKGA